jgi:protein TonB
MPPRHEDIGNKANGFENTECVEDGIDPALDPRNSGNGVVAPPPAAPDANRPLTFVSIKPEYPGGEAALAKYLQKSIRYPHMAQENGIQGMVFIRFVVNRDGAITGVEIMGAPKGGGLEEEAMRVVRNMPRWKPGRQNGQNVAVFFNLPINFTLNP